MKRLFAISLAFSILSTEALWGAGATTTWNDEEYVTSMDLDTIRESKEWDGSPDSIPVGFTEAIETTGKWMNEHFSDSDWFLSSIALQKYPPGNANKWTWYVEYRNGKSSVVYTRDDGQEVMNPDRLAFVLSMDGDLSVPERK